MSSFRVSCVLLFSFFPVRKSSPIHNKPTDIRVECFFFVLLRNSPKNFDPLCPDRCAFFPMNIDIITRCIVFFSHLLEVLLLDGRCFYLLKRSASSNVCVYWSVSVLLGRTYLIIGGKCVWLVHNGCGEPRPITREHKTRKN